MHLNIQELLFTLQRSPIFIQNIRRYVKKLKKNQIEEIETYLQSVLPEGDDLQVEIMNNEENHNLPIRPGDEITQVHPNFQVLSEAFSQNAWKPKMEAIDSLKSHNFQQNQIDLFLNFLKEKTKNFKESNLQINKSLIEIILIISKKALIKKTQIQIITNLFMEKMSDSKFVESLKEILHHSCEDNPTNYIPILHALVACKQQKTQIEFSKYFENIKIKPIVEQVLPLSKSLLTATQITAKTACIPLLKNIYAIIGVRLWKEIQEVGPTVIKNLQQEFKDVEYQKETKDASLEINKLVKNMQSTDWKIRKIVLEQLETIIEGQTISINGLHDFFSALKLRLTDANKVVLRGYLTFLGHFVEAVGKDIKTYGQFVLQRKMLLSTIILNLADKQQQVRNEIISLLNVFGEKLSYEYVINTTGTCLNNESTDSRMEYLKWLGQNQEGLLKAEIKNLVGPLVSCVLDKSKEVRHQTEIIVNICLKQSDLSVFEQGIKDLKPALKRQANEFFQRFEGQSKNKSQVQSNEVIKNNSTIVFKKLEYEKPKLSEPQIIHQETKTQQKVQETSIIIQETQTYQKVLQPIIQFDPIPPVHTQKRNVSIQVNLSSEEIVYQNQSLQVKQIYDIYHLKDECINFILIQLKEKYPKIHKKIISFDFKIYCQVVSALVLENDLDLWFKYCHFRLFDNFNPHVQESFLLFLLIIIQHSRKKAQALSQNIDLILILINQSNLKFREKYEQFQDQIFQEICEQFPQQIIISILNLIKIQRNYEYLITLLYQFIDSKNWNSSFNHLLDEILNTEEINGNEQIYKLIQNKKSAFSLNPNNFLIGLPYNLQLILSSDPQQIQEGLFIYRNIVQNPLENIIHLSDQITKMNLQFFINFYSFSFKDYDILELFLENLLVIYSSKEFVKRVQYQTLQVFTKEVMVRLIEHSQDNQQPISTKALNKVLVTLLQSIESNNLFNLLLDYLIFYNGNPISFCTLAIRCILSKLQYLQDIIQQLNIPMLFAKLHQYFTSHEQLNEDCVKIIKTIIHHITNFFQDGIYIHYNLFKEENHGDVYIEQYIKATLNNFFIEQKTQQLNFHQQPTFSQNNSLNQGSNIQSLKNSQSFEKSQEIQFKNIQEQSPQKQFASQNVQIPPSNLEFDRNLSQSPNFTAKLQQLIDEIQSGINVDHNYQEIESIIGEEIDLKEYISESNKAYIDYISQKIKIRRQYRKQMEDFKKNRERQLRDRGNFSIQTINNSIEDSQDYYKEQDYQHSSIIQRLSQVRSKYSDSK